MNDNPRKNAKEQAVKKKDMYTAVLIGQIISAVILVLAFNFSVKPNESAYRQLKDMLGLELFTLGDIAETLKSYFSGENSWAVSGNNVTVIVDATDSTGKKSSEEAEAEETEVPETEETDNLNGEGGEDLDIYEAAANTSFAPIKATSPAIMPIENGRYTSYFGYRINPITDEFSFHTGLDIAAAEGTKIRAAYSGKVTKVGEDSRAGKYIFISHDDGFVTFYCHCSEVLAEVGANIRQGETIARVGSTGWSTGPHLHFEVRKDNIRYNPLYILENDADC